MIRTMIGIIGAMDEEVAAIREAMSGTRTADVCGISFLRGRIGTEDAVLLKSGIGKVAAAVGAALLIREFAPRLVVNTGAAGAADPALEIGDIVIARECVHHDADVAAFGYEPGALPNQPRFFRCGDELVERAAAILEQAFAGKTPRPRVVVGTAASGDSFVADMDRIRAIRSLFPGCSCVDMESAAVAQVCATLSVPALIIRAVSDRADHTGASDFSANLALAAGNSAASVIALLYDSRSKT